MTSAPASRKVAAFDFDGTLARGDSLLPFLNRLIGRARVMRSVARHAHVFALVGLGRANRDLVKERYIAYTLHGHDVGHVSRIGKQYASWLIGARLFPEVMERLEWHREQGHELVMVSATLDVYLIPLAEQLGFDKLLCTQLEKTADGLTTGRLIGSNVRADEKARLLQTYLAESEVEGEVEVELWAYGNSEGDHAMLAMARHAYMVDRKGTIRPHSQ